jgi:ABC-type transport system substrate-binding protein
MRKMTMLSLVLVVFLWPPLSLQAASVQPKRGGTITFAISKELALMNPLVNTSSTESRIRELMYEPLLARDSKGAIQARLAESWEVSKDGKLYTFRLRKNVKFHNGKEMTADDIKFALDYTLNPKNGAYGFEDLNAVDRAEAADKYTLKIHMKRHNRTFAPSRRFPTNPCLRGSGSRQRFLPAPARSSSSSGSPASGLFLNGTTSTGGIKPTSIASS